MNLHTTSFFNSNEVHISSRMNEYMKKNFGYEVEGDFDTLQEAKKSLQAEQLELKDNYMSAKYVENMLMIETITSLLKAHGEKPNSVVVTEATNKVSMAKLKAGDTVQILAKGPDAERSGFKKGDNPYGEGNEVKILGFGVVPYKEKASKNHVMADSFVDFKDLYKKEIRNLKSDEDYERSLAMKLNSRARLNTIVNDIVPKPGYVGFIIEPLGDSKKVSSNTDLLYISQSIIDDKWVLGWVDDLEFDLVSGQMEAVKEKSIHEEDSEELITKIAEWIYHESSEPISEIEHLVKKADAVGDYMDAVSESKESIKEDGDEEKGPDHYRWKNDSQLSQAERLLAVCIEKLDDAITYRAENSHLFFNNGDKAGTGDLYSMKDKLEELHNSWDEQTEYYGM